MSLAGLALSAVLVTVSRPVARLHRRPSAANLGAFGLLWFGKFAVCEELLFA